MRYLVDARTVWLLAIFGLLALVAFGTGAFLGVRGVVKERRATAVIQRADSIMRDWVERGCAPKSRARP